MVVQAGELLSAGERTRPPKQQLKNTIGRDSIASVAVRLTASFCTEQNLDFLEVADKRKNNFSKFHFSAFGVSRGAVKLLTGECPMSDETRGPCQISDTAVRISGVPQSNRIPFAKSCE
jgi:hypothetical protein